MNVVKIFEELIKDLEGVEFFVGGSRRFGYNRDQSDHDFFIYLPKVITSDPKNVISYIESGLSNSINYFLSLLNIDPIGVTRGKIKNGKNNNSGYIEGAVHVKTTIFGNIIDLTFFEAKEEYLFYKKDHEKVDEFLKTNPEIIEVYKKLQLSGILKYRAILEVIKAREGRNENQ